MIPPVWILSVAIVVGVPEFKGLVLINKVSLSSLLVLVTPFFFSKVSQPEWLIRTGARFTSTVFVYLIKTFYLCHFILEF